MNADGLFFELSLRNALRVLNHVESSAEDTIIVVAWRGGDVEFILAEVMEIPEFYLEFPDSRLAIASSTEELIGNDIIRQCFRDVLRDVVDQGGRILCANSWAFNDVLRNIEEEALAGSMALRRVTNNLVLPPDLRKIISQYLMEGG